jgi:hypothetical protein
MFLLSLVLPLLLVSMGIFPLFVGRSVTIAHNRHEEYADGETNEGAS